MAVIVRVDMDQKALAQFTGWGGPVGKSIERLAKETTWRAQMRSPKRTGALRQSIHYVLGTWKHGLEFKVGSKIPYALYMEQGTKPHPIHAKNAPFLVFYWPKVGRVVHFKKVNHPGTRPYRFLWKALDSAMRSWVRGG